MAKSKNHSNHNQAHKNHRNGIKRPVANVYESLKCVKEITLIIMFNNQVNAKFLRNRRNAIKNDPKQNKHYMRYQKQD